MSKKSQKASENSEISEQQALGESWLLDSTTDLLRVIKWSVLIVIVVLAALMMADMVLHFTRNSSIDSTLQFTRIILILLLGAVFGIMRYLERKSEEQDD